MLKTELEEMVARHEGYRSKPYRCPAGKLTIGYGYNLDAGMPEDEAHLLMRHRLTKLRSRIESRHPWFASLSGARQQVLLDMAYQLGFDGLLKFRRFLDCVAAQNFAEAAKEMLDSKWARQDSPARAKELASMMEQGYADL